ncbi:DUF1345 domain-containing protein [Devosia sp. Leaf64]|uniref:DUF1345 domain-containing protein n=1 Tax=Devosia sp. Leaf64 TaxID=1736229 RepID=UPI0007140B83|nr:DUF1345 domain-containing protein [Devosia sp. Leaf64]KQN76517.1 hypothetical protein ASE94_19475 [Devosia sp. Leaf64]
MRVIGLLRAYVAPPSFIAFAVALVVAVSGALLAGVPISESLLFGFDAACVVFLLYLLRLRGHDALDMRRSAAANDTNRTGLLAITIVILLVVLVSIGTLVGDKISAAGEIPLVLVTLALAWLFANVVFGLHYAHLYYGQADGSDRGGLDFPKVDTLDYWDFFYFSFTLGMTFQTSDVSIESGSFRRVVLIHTMAAFAFNIGILAYAINILGGQT